LTAVLRLYIAEIDVLLNCHGVLTYLDVYRSFAGATVERLTPVPFAHRSCARLYNKPGHWVGQRSDQYGRPTAHSANAGNACHAGQQQSHVTDGSNKWVA